MNLLSRWRGLKEPCDSILATREDEWTISITPGSPVILVTDRLVRRYDDGFLFKVLARFGYRGVERNPWHGGGATLYVRPLPLWVIHVACHWIHVSTWNWIDWLFRHGVISTSVDEGLMKRWRNYRPWRMGKYHA